MVEINEIEFIEETEYFKFQHGACFYMLDNEKKENRSVDNLQEKIFKNNFIISNVKQKGLYFFNKRVQIFSLLDFLYKIDNDNKNIQIKSLPFEENVVLIENNKSDDRTFIYTDRQNIYIFDYDKDEIKLHCGVNIKINKLKHIGDFMFIILSDDKKIYFLKDKEVYECLEITEPINNVDEKNGLFLFTHADKEIITVKDENRKQTYDLSSFSKDIDIPYENCNIICAKILECDKKEIKLFIVVLYNNEGDITCVTYDINIEGYEIKRVNYSMNDFFFEEYKKEEIYIKTMYISEWKILVCLSSESCEVVVYTHNDKLSEMNKSNDMKVLCIKEGYKINTRESDTFFLSLFMYSKYVDKIYRKSKLGNVPFLKNPVVFFLLQQNFKIVVEYLDQFKLEDNIDGNINSIKDDTIENDMKEVSLLPTLMNDIIENYNREHHKDIFKIFKTKKSPNEQKETKEVKNEVKSGQHSSLINTKLDEAKNISTTTTTTTINNDNNNDNNNTKKGYNFPFSMFGIGTGNKSATSKNVVKEKPTTKLEELQPMKKIEESVEGLQIREKDQAKRIEEIETKRTDKMEKYAQIHKVDQIKEMNNIQYIHEIKSKMKNENDKEEANISDILYEDKHIIINKISGKYNKLIKNSMFMSEHILKDKNINTVKKNKIAKFNRRKEYYYNADKNKIIFLDEDDEEDKKSKKNQKSDFHTYFNPIDLDMYYHEKLSDEHCEKIIKKIERKHTFLFNDIKSMFVNVENVNANDSKYESHNENYNKNNNTNFDSKQENKNNTNITLNYSFELDISKDDMNRFYQELDKYFLKKKLLKVKNDFFDKLKNYDEYNKNIFQTVFYNIYMYNGLNTCELFIYFILRNMQVPSFPSSLYILQNYFVKLIILNMKLRDIDSNILNDLWNNNHNNNDSIKRMLNNKSLINKFDQNNKNKNKNKSSSIYYEGLTNFDSEYSADGFYEEDIYKKVKNEKDEDKKMEYLSKIIPLFKDELNKEEEVAIFNLVNSGVNFLNSQICTFFSQKLLPIIYYNNLNSLDKDIGVLKIFLSNFVLSDDDLENVT
ncbi:hypothetical protein PFFVO_01449 [Plasmodium falciparum Vietnam Oak-Knoll (FVO)]|uniref:Uncharacterized protein n=1 Tax=Plasmodium falciparum Vietnam Oak-Knoll (FVO) TaxID=1036723 RepID=A0A024V9F2_PLAFA|nr:hypothetical protein PFFVO_01449 [Plasmodium falciparum Vietnam Oak-Knoll (FVO)]